MSRRAERVLSLTVFYLLVSVTTLVGDVPHKAAFLVALAVVCLAIGIVTDRLGRRDG